MNDKNLILVPFDKSPEAEKALEHAVGVADPNDEILILMVLPEPDSDPFFEITNNNSVENLTQYLESLILKYRSSGIKLLIEIHQGNIVDEILKAGDNPRCKLIVIGYKGVSKIGKFVLGSISGEVAKRAKTPVLVVR